MTPKVARLRGGNAPMMLPSTAHCASSLASAFSTAKEISAGAGASVSTIKRRLAQKNLKSHVPAKKPRLSDTNKTVRCVSTSRLNTPPGPRTIVKLYFFPTSLPLQHAGTKSNVCGALSTPDTTPFTCRKSHRAAALLSMFRVLCPEMYLAFSTAVKDR
ncbi:hypothetical protein HPB49_007074 [Dermacentor silvarum]|uniref:Uncharacterized protein n=1 Tax=Dermacentor silvarum TaxID=543639 RepID=A0ACB8C7Z7_DERSI|nr:hypothetical protein HPB49_007074 [Dermacentor silvarum]